MFMSLSALIRYDQLDKKIPASNFFERYLDTHYNDNDPCKYSSKCNRKFFDQIG